VRVALLLAGGGEFAFVVFKLASDLSVLPEDLGKLLTASVIISMSLTPILAEVADWAGNQIEMRGRDKSVTCVEDECMTEEEEEEAAAEMLRTATPTKAPRAFTPEELSEGAIVVCGYGEVGRMVCGSISQNNDKAVSSGAPVQPYICFERDMSLFQGAADEGDPVVFGDGANGAVIRCTGVEEPKAILVTYSWPLYSNDDRCLEAVEQLRTSFPEAPIYTRAQKQDSVALLKAAGATSVVLESGVAAHDLSSMIVTPATELDGVVTPTSGMTAAALSESTGIPLDTITILRGLYDTCPVQDKVTGNKQLAELRNELMRDNEIALDDKTLATWMGYDEALSKWVTGSAESTFVSFDEFVTFAAKIKDKLKLVAKP
jgi:voltage-gated potassium channel Kch